MGPVGRVLSNFGERAGPSVFGPLQLLQLTVVFFAGQRGQPNKFSPNLLAIFKGRRGIGKGMGETEV